MKFIITAYTSMTDGVYYVDTIDGKHLYSLKMQDAYRFDTNIGADLIMVRIRIDKIKHRVIQVID